MRRSTKIALAITTAFIVVAGGVAAYPSLTSKSASSTGTTKDAPSSVKGEGKYMDVATFLSDRGLGMNIGISKDAAYSLAPFGVSREPGGSPTCMFYMTNVTYPGTGPIAAHPIRDNSTIRLRPRQVDGDGNQGEFLPGEGAKLNIQELTGEYFAGLASGLGSSCGDDLTFKPYTK
jgi:hypothetical protein